MWLELFRFWLENVQGVPESSKPILNSIRTTYDKNPSVFNQLDPDIAALWVKEILRFRYMAMLFFRDARESKAPSEELLDLLLMYVMWDMLTEILTDFLTEKQIKVLASDKEVMYWVNTGLSSEYRNIGKEYFNRLASGYELENVDPVNELQNKPPQPEKMKQFFEVFETNFFNTYYDIFDFYFLGLIFLILVVGIFIFFKFLKKLLKKKFGSF